MCPSMATMEPQAAEERRCCEEVRADAQAVWVAARADSGETQAGSEVGMAAQVRGAVWQGAWGGLASAAGWAAPPMRLRLGRATGTP